MTDRPEDHPAPEHAPETPDEPDSGTAEAPESEASGMSDEAEAPESEASGTPDGAEADESGAAEPSETPEAPGIMETPVTEEAGEAGAPEAEGGPSLRAQVEAILLVVDEPVAEITLAQLLERPVPEISATLRELAAEYTEQGRGFDLRDVAGGWRFYTRDICAPVVEKFVTDGQQARLTQAALETLAVVAYRQPVSRARVSAVRGVNSDGVMRTLALRGLIEEAGQDPESQAILFRTTGYFLERLGLRNLDELPDLAPYLPDDLPEEIVEEA